MSRRDLLLYTAVAALVVAGIVATRREPVAAPEVAPRPVTVSPTADRAPAPGQEDQLPWLATALPREIVIDPATAVPLAADPVGRALALLNTSPQTGSRYDQLANLVYVLGDDARLRRLDLALAPTVDANGDPHSAFGTTVLKPDGTQAAFPQRDRVVLVDLTTATVRELAVPGRNLRVVWLGEQLLAVQPGATVQVDPSSGRVTPRPYAGSGLVAGRPPGASVLDLVSRDGSWLVRTWSDSTRTATTAVAALPADASASQPGWALGSLVALDFRATSRGAATVGRRPAPDRAESVVAFDSNSGAAFGRLELTRDAPPARAPGCCAVLGWLGPRRVLLDVPGAGRWLLAWEPLTGKVYRVSRVAYRGGRLAMSVVDGSRR